MNRRIIGAHGEDVAVQYLTRHGYRILERNYTTRHGELDIVAAQGNTVVFVEVKYRRGTEFGRPEEAVGHTKLEHLKAAMIAWCAESHHRGPVRLDVLAILETNHGPSCELFRDVLT